MMHMVAELKCLQLFSSLHSLAPKPNSSDRMPSSKTKLTPNTEASQARADRADNTMENLCLKLVEFLVYVQKEVWNSSGCGHATEQARSAGHATEQAWSAGLVSGSPRDDYIEQECEEIAVQKITEWSHKQDYHAFYDEPALLLHKKMFDIMNRGKWGLPKENTFVRWCRRVNKHKATSTTTGSTAAEHAQATSTATEHAESILEKKSFKAFAFDMLSNDLTPEQRDDPIYKIRTDLETGDIKVSNKQRSWMNNILRRIWGTTEWPTSLYVCIHIL
jgi:hypothetical protein